MPTLAERPANTLIILDFETTGLSPTLGDRAIEIGAVRLVDGIVTDRFQQLMNPGFRISSFIESYTGITNRMLASAPPCEEVMEDFVEFIGDDNLVAHNAAFDKRFLDAELEEIGRDYAGGLTCSMLIARRLYQRAPSHALGNLVAYHQLLAEDVFHRALADSEMTARLWLKMLTDLEEQHALPCPSFRRMQQLSRKPKRSVGKFLEKCRKG
ncbi:MAG: 3'-5' exonuclease [Bacteroidota bacterium]